MSGTNVDTPQATATGVATLIARIGEADRRAQARGLGLADDLFRPESMRLDDRVRARLDALLRALVACVERDLVDYAARLLRGRGAEPLAELLVGRDHRSFERLRDGGVLQDREFIEALMARVQLDQLSAAMPIDAPDEPERPSMLARLVHANDRLVASAASALMAAETERRSLEAHGSLTTTGLPLPLHARLVWWVVAALSVGGAEGAGDALPALERALADAARRSIDAHDEEDRAEGAAMRLALAIDARDDEVPLLLAEAVSDRRLTLVAALLSHALKISADVISACVIDPDPGRLHILLRAHDLPRESLARIDYALCEADGRRPLHDLPERIEAAMAIDPDQARTALQSLRLDPAYRSALRMMTGAAPR